MSTNIVKFTNVYLYIDKTAYDVSGFTIFLRENAIPEVQLSIATGYTNKNNVAELVNLETLHRLVNKFQQYAIQKQKANFTVTMHINDKISHSLTLNDWIITGAGIGEASSSHFEPMTITLQHPVCLCDYTAPEGLSVFNRINDEAFLDNVSTTNIIETICDTLTIIANDPIPELNVYFGKNNQIINDVSTACAQFKSKLLSSVNILRTSLKWSPNFLSNTAYSDFPFADKGYMLTHIQNAIVNYVRSGLQTSVWNMLVGILVPEFALTIVPTFADPYLIIKPSTYWGDPVFTFSDANAIPIRGISFPSIDPSPIIGTIIDANIVANNYSILVEDPGTSGLEPQLNIVYAPKFQQENFIGGYKTLSAPDWLINIKYNSQYTIVETNNPNNINPDTTQPSGTINIDRNDFNEMLYLYAKQAFLTLFRQSVQISFDCPLLIQSQLIQADAKYPYLIPGVTARLYSGDSNNAVDFYITEVVHKVDCAMAQAITAISGRYVRPSFGLNNIFEIDNMLNPLYLSNGE